MYSLHQIQKIPVSLDKAWDFFSDPKKLKVITPDYMGFDIVSGGDEPMFPGQIIEYTVSPVANIKTRWVTEITHVVEKEYFVDEQRIGSYKFWHHTHFLKEITGGTEVGDTVHYKLPFGLLGKFAHPLLVKPKLDEIFFYRRKKLKLVFKTPSDR